MISDRKPQGIVPALGQAEKLLGAYNGAAAIRTKQGWPSLRKGPEGVDLLVRQATLATAKLEGCRLHLSCGVGFCTLETGF